MTERLRILVVDHNAILREGISVVIEMQPDFELVGSISAAAGAIDRFAAARPDLTLMDLDLPSDSGLDAILRIRQMDPAAWIIGLVTDEGNERCQRAVVAGVSALLAKEQIGAMLISLIRMGKPQDQFGLDESWLEEPAQPEAKLV
jgi:DNA-binding NarL/FixJ family response regulator